MTTPTTPATLVSYVETKINKTGKSGILYDGMNWVKNDLLQHGLERLWKIGVNIPLEADRIDYALPSDFGLPDLFYIIISTTTFYQIYQARTKKEIIESIYQGYPSSYYLYGNNRILVGNQRPGGGLNLKPYYFERVSDYTSTGASQPIFIAEYGTGIYEFGMEWYLFDSLGLKQEANVAMHGTLNPDGVRTPCYATEKAKILSQEMRKGVPLVKPLKLYT